MSKDQTATPQTKDEKLNRIISQELNDDEKETAVETFDKMHTQRNELKDVRKEFFRELGRKSQLSPKRGQVRKYNEQFVTIVKALAALGLPEDNMAHLFEVNPRTFQRWKKAHPSFAMKIKEGRALRNSMLLQGMIKSVKDGSYAVQIFLAKNWLGMTDKVEETHKGGMTITYKSRIPREKNLPDVDPESVKKPGPRR
jgi:hypothetical protein